MSQTTTTTLNTASTVHQPTTSVPIFADFNYYLPPQSGSGPPSTNDLELILGAKDQDTRRLAVTDARGREDEFTLDTNGFCNVRNPTKLSAHDFDSDEEIENRYYGEVEQILKDL